jgi:AcrR family transcriptional regulator
MSSKPSRKITSRRDRPAKAPLSRDVIVSTALDMLAKDGLAGLSLRRVATALETGAASLYVYLVNLDELYALMFDQALGELAPTASDGFSPRERLKNYLMAYLHVLLARPGLAHVAMTTVASGPNSLRMWEMLLGLLKEVGVPDARLVAGIDMLLLHVTSVAAEESNRHAMGQDFERVTNALADASADQFPLLATLFRQGMFPGSDDDDARVRWALDVMIEGITANQGS